MFEQALPSINLRGQIWHTKNGKKNWKGGLGLEIHPILLRIGWRYESFKPQNF